MAIFTNTFLEFLHRPESQEHSKSTTYTGMMYQVMLCIRAERTETHNFTLLLSSLLDQHHHNKPSTVFLLFFVFLFPGREIGQSDLPRPYNEIATLFEIPYSRLLLIVNLLIMLNTLCLHYSMVSGRQTLQEAVSLLSVMSFGNMLLIAMAVILSLTDSSRNQSTVSGVHRDLQVSPLAFLLSHHANHQQHFSLNA